MNKKNIFTIGLIAVVVIVGIYFFGEKIANNQSPSNLSSTTPVSVSQSEWKTYENTKYQYEFSYPMGILIQNVQEEDRATVQTTVGLSAGGMEVTANGFISSALASTLGLDPNQLSNKDLESFARVLWQNEKKDQSPYIFKEISDIKQIAFASTTAYTFTEKQTGTEYAAQEAAKKGLSSFPPWKKMYIFFFIKNPNDGKPISISVTDDAIAQQMLKTFAFTHGNMAGIPARDTWLTYENTTHYYRINYPPNSDAVRVDPYPDEYTRIRPSIGDTIQIPTPRGTLGIWSLTSTSTAVHNYYPVDQQDAVNRIRYLSSLNLKSFVEALCNEQAQRASTRGSDQNGYPSLGFGMCRTSNMQEGTVSGQSSYTINIMGRLDTLFTTVLVPGLLQEYKYTFLANKNGKKFLIWYPAEEPVFKEMLDSFSFVP